MLVRTQQRTISSKVESMKEVVPQLLAYGCLAEADGLPNLSLGKLGLVHVVDRLTMLREEAGVFFTHSQFVAKLD